MAQKKSSQTGWFSHSPQPTVPIVVSGADKNSRVGFAKGANTPLPRRPVAQTASKAQQKDD